MANTLFNIEILMGVSKNMREQNDDWRREVFLQGRERAMRAQELLALFEQEYANLDQETQRLAQYLPRQAVSNEDDRPKVADRGQR